MAILNLGNCSTHWQPISTAKLCIHSSLNSSQMRWKKNSRTFSKSSVAVGVMDSSRTPSKDKNVQLFHFEAAEDLVQPSSEKPAEQNKSYSDPLPQLRHGAFLENRLLYRHKFVIRSYEVATSITTIFSFFQIWSYKGYEPSWTYLGCCQDAHGSGGVSKMA